MAKGTNEEIWSKEEEKYFFERYSNAGSDRKELLLGQASILFAQNLRKDNSLW